MATGGVDSFLRRLARGMAAAGLAGQTDRQIVLCKGANAALCEVCQIPPAGRGVFDVNSRTRLLDVTDGTSQTFAAGEGAGNNVRFGFRRYYQDTTAATDLFPGQSPRIDQSWSAGPAATRELNSLGLLGGSHLGITALRGGHADPRTRGLVACVVDAPMHAPARVDQHGVAGLEREAFVA